MAKQENGSIPKSLPSEEIAKLLRHRVLPDVSEKGCNPYSDPETAIEQTRTYIMSLLSRSFHPEVLGDDSKPATDESE